MIEICDRAGNHLKWITSIVDGKAWNFQMQGASSFAGEVPSDDPAIGGLHTDGFPFLCKGRRVIRTWRWMQAPVNTVTNPSLEQSIAGYVATAGAQIGRATGDAWGHGTNVLAVTPAGGGTDQGVVYDGGGPGEAQVEALEGQPTAVGAYVKGTSGRKVKLGVAEWNAAGAFLRSSFAPAVTLGGSWEQLTYALTPGAGTVRISIYVVTDEVTTTAFRVSGVTAEPGLSVSAWGTTSRQRVVTFAGPVWSTDDSGDKNGKVTTSFIAYSPLKMGASRLCRSEHQISTNWEDTQHVFDDVDSSYIARWLLAVVNQEKGHTGLEPGFKTYLETVRDLAADDHWQLDILDPDFLNSVTGDYHSLTNFDLGGAPATTGPAGIAGDPNRSLVLTGGDLWFTDAASSVPPVIGGDVFTIAGMIKLSGDTHYGIVQQDNGGGGTGGPVITRVNSAGGRKLRLYRSDGSLVCESTVAIPENVWVHFVVTKSGSTVKIYINGVDVTGTVTNATMNAGANGRFTLFSSPLAASAFQGGADEFSVWNGTALTYRQVQDLYAASAGVPLDYLGNVFELSGTTRTIAYEKRRLDSAIQELATNAGGFDIRETFLARTDGRHARLDILAQRGTQKDSVKFGYLTPPHNLVVMHRTESMEQHANDIFGQAQPAFGSDQNLNSVAQDAASITAYGTFEEFELFPDIADQGLLDDLVTEELSFRLVSGEIVQWSVLPGARSPMYWDDFEVGDIVPVAAGPAMRGGFLGLQRIYGAQVVADKNGVEYVNSVTTMPS